MSDFYLVKSRETNNSYECRKHGWRRCRALATVHLKCCNRSDMRGAMRMPVIHSPVSSGCLDARDGCGVSSW